MGGGVFSADKPLTDPKEDRLGYAPFAEYLAKSICEMVPPEGLVIAVYGPWGSGKTTLLNFVRHYLERKPKNQRPIIVRFNPWWFSGHEDLVRRFFDQLQAALSRWRMGRKLRKLIAKLAEVVAQENRGFLGSAGRMVAELANAEHKDVFELKDKIANLLRKKGKQILVIIDDIDRLIPEEIGQLFRIIKAVADLPNVTYLLAFDRDMVAKALTEAQRVPGEAYLEKIVQVPLELPFPDKDSLRRLLLERLDTILDDTSDGLFGQAYWVKVYLDGVDPFITTPRDVTRLTNTISVTYPAVKGEVNPVDFIAVETLRVFCPLVYDIVRKNPEMFTGHSKGYPDYEMNELKSFHDSWINQVQEGNREVVKKLLMHIFPKLKAVWEDMHYGAEWELAWRKKLRICSPEVFPVYFRLAIPEGGISRAEMQAFLALAGDAKAFGAKLIELANEIRPNGMTRVSLFLERLEDYAEKEIPLDCIPSILQALFDVGDQLLRPEDEGPEMLGLGNDIRISRVIFRLLRRLDEPQRFEVLQEAISNGKAVSIIVMEIAEILEEEGLFTAEHREELKRLALEKIRDAARQNVLLQAPKLVHILHRWRDWAGEQEVKQWVQDDVIGDDQKLVEFLEKFLQEVFEWSLPDGFKIHYRLDFSSLELFLEPSQIIDRVRRLAKKPGLTENQRTLELFIQKYGMGQHEIPGCS